MALLKSGYAVGGLVDHALPAQLRANSGPAPLAFARNSDEYWMAEALKEAMNGVGITAPNPAVGCVFVLGDECVARGSTQAFGGKHAERVAFDSLTQPLPWDKVTAYVTLEPCSHTGKQPPCVDLFLDKPFARIVIASDDPNPIVHGSGIEKLRKAGHTVEVGCLKNEAVAWNYPFMANNILKRPIIVGKWAQSIDGHLADETGNWRWITGPESRAYTHWLRQKYDAIAVGAGTVLNDFPSLDVRDCANAGQHDPLKIIFDPNGRMFEADLSAQNLLLQKTFAPERKVVILADSELLKKHNSEWSKTLKNLENVRLVGMQKSDNLAESFENAISEVGVLEFHEKPIQSVLVEGGPRFLSILLQENRFDLLHVFTAPFFIGGTRNRIAQTGSTPSAFPKCLKIAERYELLSQHWFGNDTLAELIPYEHKKAIFS